MAFQILITTVARVDASKIKTCVVKFDTFREAENAYNAIVNQDQHSKYEQNALKLYSGL